MNASLPHLLLSLLLAGFANGAAHAQAYLDETLQKPAYLQSWNAMLKGERKVDPWLAQYARQRNGATSPASAVQLGAENYELHSVCEAHNCEANRFYVLFTLGGKRAWGYQIRDDRQERFFGKPDAQKKEVLRAAAGG